MRKEILFFSLILTLFFSGFVLISCDEGGTIGVRPSDESKNEGDGSCQDECVVNALRCIDGKSYICGFFDADRCSEWSEPLFCPGGCADNGECKPFELCENLCSIEDRRCDGTDGFQFCTLGDDVCLIWSQHVACLEGSRCHEGYCLSGTTCDDACPLGTHSCVSSTSTRSCIVDAEGCAVWGAETACAAGHECVDGSCEKTASTCKDACVEGEVSCANATSKQTCIVGDDGCTVWGSADICLSGYQCEDGQCVKAPISCTNECVLDARRCENEKQYQVCAYYNDAPCTTWGGAKACASTERCDKGQCVVNCTDACTAGAKECSGAGFRTCGDYNKNGCTEWSSITACSHGCSNGVCKPDPNAWVPKCTTNPCPKVISSFPYTRSSTTKGGVNNISTYTSCSNLSQAGPEEYYVFRVTEPGVIVAGITEKSPVDVDIHLLSSLSGSKCIARSDKGIAEHLKAGIYYLSVDTFTSASNAGAYSIYANFLPDSGKCGLKTGIMERVNQPSRLSMPATGKVVKEAHLVTTVDQGSNTSWWPSSKTDALAKHKARTASITGINYTRTENWAPAGEGGSKYGQGSTGRAIPEDAEAWYVCMYWAKSTRPAPGTRYLVINPSNGKAVVAAAGYETGPGDGAMIGGAVEEVHQFCGTGHKSNLTFAELRDQTLYYGPIDCE